jgi:hypothetical protein
LILYQLLLLGIGVIAAGFVALVLVVDFHLKRLRRDLMALITLLENQ